MATYNLGAGTAGWLGKGSEWAEKRIVQPTVKRQPARFRGPLSSDEYNTFQDAVVHDIFSLSTATNANANRIDRALRQLTLENSYLRRQVESFSAKFDYRDKVLSLYNPHQIDRYIDLKDSSYVHLDSTIDSNKRANYKSQYGEFALPATAIENKFFSFSLRSGGIVVPPDLLVATSSIFDKLLGQGAIDYEYGGTLVEGNTRNAFNGMNESAYIRTVSFPLESSVEEVEVQIDAVVPATITAQANLLEIAPYPQGSVDVTQIATASDLGASFKALDSFVVRNNAQVHRYHFAPATVEQVRIRLRCRNWREIDGKKVFTYGLQELGLKLVDYNKNFTEDGNFGENITGMLKIEASEGNVFDTIYRIDPSPNFLLEDAGSRHVRMQLSTTPNFIGQIWDSKSNQAPQDAGNIGISAQGSSILYAIFTLKFVSSSGGYRSPFSIGSTPYLRGLGLTYSSA